jgi:hypothetical protein
VHDAGDIDLEHLMLNATAYADAFLDFYEQAGFSRAFLATDDPLISPASFEALIVQQARVRNIRLTQKITVITQEQDKTLMEVGITTAPS